jgi:hypothetical protein
MRLLTGLTLALALLTGTAHATSGRLTTQTYRTMREAARATGALLFNKNLLETRVFSPADMSVAKGYKATGAVRTLTVNGPQTPFGYPLGRVQVQVKKVAGGYKGFTDTGARPVLLK